MNIITTNKMTMTSREIADLVESRHDSVKRSIERLAERGVIQLPPVVEVKNNQSLSPNSKGEIFVFSGEQGKRDSIVVVAQLSPEFTARLVDRWQELEAAAAKSAIAVPQSLPEALRLAADLAEQKAIAEAERDEAIRTKALIGSKREATAMATAAAAKRESERLAIELDLSKQYASVKRMEAVYPSRKFNWRELKKASIELGLKAKDIFDPNFKSVKAYHAAVWRAVYSIDTTMESENA